MIKRLITIAVMALSMLISETAKVQIIHNSPYPTVDIYVNGEEALGDVPYRATTDLIEKFALVICVFFPLIRHSHPG